MAKATSQAYQVVGSPLAYNGKVAQAGDVLNDIPGESISWLLDGGHIVATSDAVTGASSLRANAPAPFTFHGKTFGTPISTPEPEPVVEPEPAPTDETEAGA
jgi:hypothetical protein